MKSAEWKGLLKGKNFFGLSFLLLFFGVLRKGLKIKQPKVKSISPRLQTRFSTICFRICWIHSQTIPLGNESNRREETQWIANDKENKNRDGWFSPKMQGNLSFPNQTIAQRRKNIYVKKESMVPRALLQPLPGFLHWINDLAAFTGLFSEASFPSLQGPAFTNESTGQGYTSSLKHTSFGETKYESS